MEKLSMFSHPLFIALINSLSLLLIFVPTLIGKYSHLQPFRRGFFCDDESIRYPNNKSTVSFNLVWIIGVGIPLGIIVLTEIFHQRENLIRKSNVYRNLPVVIMNCYTFCGIFFFGVGFDQSLTNLTKFVIGRLRPHFLDACKLDISKLNCSDHAYVYIENSACAEKSARALKHMRMSFPSGHSSLSAYGAVAFTIYLTKRWNLGHFQILRVLIQILYIGLAIMCGFSRISDYKHHWSDVAYGMCSGTVVAIVIWYVFLRVNVDEEVTNGKRHQVDEELMA